VAPGGTQRHDARQGLTMPELMGHHAIVTGAGSGAGEAIALALCGKGARVTALGRRLRRSRRWRRRMTGSFAVSADVTDADAWRRQSQEAVERNGAPTIVIANAGSAESAPFQRTDAPPFPCHAGCQFDGVFNTFQASFVKMNRAQPGRLIAVASTAGSEGLCLCQRLLRSQARCCRPGSQPGQELARTGVTVNAICPGFTETPMLASFD
jgi:3-hydroxybutyrate dehydrogenase